MIKSKNESLSRVGTRIKAIRKNKKITQSELAGESITRNMLSRIENGLALPSLQTLVYIADRLSVPVSVLLDDTFLSDYTIAEAVRKAHGYMKEGLFDKALEVIQSKGIPESDETTLITIECNLALAAEKARQGNFFEAYRNFAQAEEKEGCTVYSTAGSTYISSLYRSVASYMLPLDESEKKTKPKFDKYIDFYIYLRLIDLFDNGQIVKAVNLAALCEIEDRILSTHIAATLDMANGKYTSAASKLRQIVEYEEKSPTPHGSLMLYRIYGELEMCAKSEGDYVLAYTYKEEKLKLYSKMSGIKL